MKRFLLLLALCLSISARAAESPYCTDPAYRQFDFWIGRWAAHDKDGRLLGHARIDRIEQGCVLQEWWRGNGEENGGGTSLSMYDRKRRLWNHTWMSVRGNYLSIDGGWQGDHMLMTGYYTNAAGVRELHRTEWRPVPDGVYHRWDFTVDGGRTWPVIHEAWLRRSDQAMEK